MSIPNSLAENFNNSISTEYSYCITYESIIENGAGYELYFLFQCPFFGRPDYDSLKTVWLFEASFVRPG